MCKHRASGSGRWGRRQQCSSRQRVVTRARILNTGTTGTRAGMCGVRAAARSNACCSCGVQHAGNCARAAAHGVQARVRRRAVARPKMARKSICGRQQSAGAARRGSLAYQLVRVGVDHYQSAALVSAGAVTSYASHSTNLSPSLSSGLKSHTQKNVTKVF